MESGLVFPAFFLFVCCQGARARVYVCVHGGGFFLVFWIFL